MLKEFKKIYFIGIGGIGMSALARWFQTNEYEVAGYDRTPSPLTEQLESEGMQIHFEDSISKIPSVFLDKHKQEVLVVYTPAVPANHQELNFFKEQGYLIKKRAEVLGMLTKDYFTIAVAGTHGKTTTSALIAHILYNSNIPFTAFLGGIMQGYEQNLLSRQSPDREIIMLAEADEYDKSFLHLHPDIAVVTSIDADHLEIYGDKKHLEATFIEFAKKIKPKGRLFAKKGLALEKNTLESDIYFADYEIDTISDCYSDNILLEEGIFIFDWHGLGENITNLSLGIPGYHNVENATVAIAVARSLDISEENIRQALSSFKGVKRRFEYVLKTPKVTYIDDYAHHPKEVEAFLHSIKAMYPHQKVTAIFQPHLYSRTQDFATEFAKSLDLADDVILLEIYPARELPIKGVSSALISDKMEIKHKIICQKSHLLDELESRKESLEVLVTIGAGDIGQMTHSIAELIKK